MATVMFTARRVVLRRPMIKVKNLDIMFSHSCPLFSVLITELSIKLGFFEKIIFNQKKQVRKILVKPSLLRICGTHLAQHCS